MANVIFHIDINAFFASAHVITDPSLIGKPVVVCSNHRGSVITTASYEARQFGIQSAMPLSHAKRLCQDLVVVEIDFDLYNDLSRRFMDIIRSYSTKLQQASIDECYVDVRVVGVSTGGINDNLYPRRMGFAQDNIARIFSSAL